MTMACPFPVQRCILQGDAVAAQMSRCNATRIQVKALATAIRVASVHVDVREVVADVA